MGEEPGATLQSDKIQCTVFFLELLNSLSWDNTHMHHWLFKRSDGSVSQMRNSFTVIDTLYLGNCLVLVLKAYISVSVIIFNYKLH